MYLIGILLLSWTHKKETQIMLKDRALAKIFGFEQLTVNIDRPNNKHIFDKSYFSN